MIAINRSQHKLMNFVRNSSPVVPPEDSALDITFCQVVATYQDRILLAYVAEREQWEVPGGGVMPNESYQDCALREFYEETAQKPSQITYCGLFKLDTTKRHEYAALYRVTLTTLAPFNPSEEISAITLWEIGTTPEEGYLHEFVPPTVAFCLGVN